MLENTPTDSAFLEACAHHRGQRLEQAINSYRAFLQTHPDCGFALFNLCLAEAMDNPIGPLLPALAKAIDLIGDDLEPYLDQPFMSFLRKPQAHRILGRGLIESGQLAAGRRLLSAAVKCQATSGLTLLQSSHAFETSIWTELAREGRLDEVFDTKTPDQPRSADDWYRIGVQYFTKRDFGRAHQAFKSMAAYDPRAGAIFRPSPIVGELSPELRPDQRLAIDALLDRYAVSEQANAMPEPLHTHRLGSRPVGSVPLDEVTMLTVFTQWVGCAPNSLPGYLAELFHGTAKRAGIRSHFSAGDPVIYNGCGYYEPNDMRTCLDNLADAYATIKPDVFLFDASYFPKANALDRLFLSRVIDRKRTKNSRRCRRCLGRCQC